MGKRKSEDDGNLNGDLCSMLNELADYEKNITENIFKYNAYRLASEILSVHPERITSGKEAKKLKGIGQKIANKIDIFLSTGTLPQLKEIRKNKKYVAIQLLTRVSGIGPRKAKELVERGIRTIEDLEKVKDELTHHQQIGLKYFYDFEKKIPRAEVSDIEKEIKEQIAKVDDKFMVTICGSYRRGKPTSGDVDCLVTHPEYTTKKSREIKLKHEGLLKDVILRLRKSNLVIDTIALGSEKFMGVCRLETGKPARRLDIRLTFMDQYFCSVLYFTGSDLFNRNMRAHAVEKGFTLNEYNLRPIGITGVPGEPVPINNEKEIFEYIDYPYKSPEHRNF